MARRSLLRPAWPLVACLAVALLWPASEVWTGWVAAGTFNRRLVIEIGPGWLGLTFGPIDTPNSIFVGARSGRSPAISLRRLTDADRQQMAFPQIYPMPGEYRFYSPLWMVTLGTSLFAAGLLVSRARRGAVPPGHCRRCGYDLRASPDRCPECGTLTPPISAGGNIP